MVKGIVVQASYGTPSIRAGATRIPRVDLQRELVPLE